MTIRPVFALAAFALAGSCAAAVHIIPPPPAATPPMGWNDWAHYECRYTATTILANAKALVATGLAAKGYATVTIDDCWMARQRDAAGNLQPNRKRFPNGIAPVVAAVHALGLKFGIYEDAGSTTCGGYAGSGAPKAGGEARFMRDFRQFAKWGVDYLKLDGCNIVVPKGQTKLAVYRTAYADAAAAIKASGRKIVFLESAPAYFQGTPAWYDVLGWVGQYGQLWREGTDIRVYDPAHPSRPRFKSIVWNYAYNLPLGRYQKPGNWNDPDFIIGGDSGVSLAETRSQMALWAMMAAPLVLSVDVGQLSPAAIRIIGNKAVIAVDQDIMGDMATLVRRTPTTDVLLKPLANNHYAVAVFNHGDKTITIDLPFNTLGFASDEACRMTVRNLWTGASTQNQRRIMARIKPHDTLIWRVDPGTGCAAPTRTGAIVMTVNGSRELDPYARCLAASGVVRPCRGTASEAWTVSADGMLHSGTQCLAVVDGAPAMRSCSGARAQHWMYRFNGNLVNAGDGRCLGVRAAADDPLRWQMQPCGHNALTQIWALPN